MESSAKFSILMSSIFLVLLCCCVITKGGFDGTLKGRFCNPMVSDPSNPHSCDVTRLKDSVRDVLIYATLGNEATGEEVDPKTLQSYCYVHGLCGSNIDGFDCNHCLVAARDLIMACAGQEGAQVTVADCQLRVEAYKFYP